MNQYECKAKVIVPFQIQFNDENNFFFLFNVDYNYSTINGHTLQTKLIENTRVLLLSGYINKTLLNDQMKIDILAPIPNNKRYCSRWKITQN